MEFPTPRTFQADVISITHVSTEYYLGKFSVTTSDEFRFVPGQYVAFHLPPPKARHTMSIASAPHLKEFEILQNVSPGGYGSQWFQSLTTGTQVTFTGPMGRFVLRDEPTRDQLFVGTGCGVSPLRAMIRAYCQNTQNSGNVHLLWGMRHETDLFWLDEWKEIQRLYPRFSFDIVLSKPTSTWHGLTGHVTDHLDVLGSYTNAYIYMCGGRTMIEEVSQALRNAHVSEDQLVHESFF